MEKLIVWGDESIFYRNSSIVEKLALDGDVEILGVCFRDHQPRSAVNAYGHPCLRPDASEWREASCFLAYTYDWSEKEIRELNALGVPRELIIPGEIINMRGFSFSRYMALVRSRLTILSNCCWAGQTYHYFRLPFLSPTINLFISDDDYIQFLENLDEMLEIEPVYTGTEYNPDEDLYYPVFSLGEVKLHMNHCRDREQGLSDWKRRRTRINRDNILVMMATKSPHMAYRFTELPFAHKVCFVPFQSKLDTCVTVDSGGVPFAHYVNSFATGARVLYDPWSLMEEGRIEYVMEKVELPPETIKAELADMVQRTSHVLVYGAWVLGKQACDLIKNYIPERMLGFAVTSMEGNPSDKMGYPVHSMTEWLELLEQQGISRNQVLVVLSLHPQYYSEVEASLRSYEINCIIHLEDMEWFFIHEARLCQNGEK